MIPNRDLIRQNKQYAKLRWGSFLGRIALRALGNLTEEFRFSVANGDLFFLERGWYVTHTGLMNLSRRSRCAGIKVQPVQLFCDPSAQRWAFEATVYTSRSAGALSAMVTPIHPMCPRLSMAPKCASPRLVP